MPKEISDNNSKQIKVYEKKIRKNKKQDNSALSLNFPVVGIGASAGGLEAFGKFFKSMPENSGIAFVLIQHLDPTHASNMVELIKRHTSMSVSEAQDGIPIEPNHIYIIPPNWNMTITDHRLLLIEQLERPGISHNIDLFFKSLASDLKDKSICIILSGTASDGTAGARAIKAVGGMVIVQDPDSAAYDGMPRSAISAGIADFILPVEKMPRRLISYIYKFYKPDIKKIKPELIEHDPLIKILLLIKARTKHDFLGYKTSTLNRRIERRIVLNKIENINDYLKFLQNSSLEVYSLVKDFLINVTSFFRDPEAFEALKDAIKKYITKNMDLSEIRVWIPGCSTGEEAYSIAIIIEEAMEELKINKHVQIFGTDLDKEAIDFARRGIYTAAIENDVNQERLKKYFSKENDQYHLKRYLREKLIFAVQDVIADPPFTKMDIISIRNLLIYFDKELQKKIIPLFHYSLNEGGVLFLGTAETIGDFSEYFTMIERKWRIYLANLKTKKTLYALPKKETWNVLNLEKAEFKEPTPEETLLEALDPSLLLDENNNLIYTHGNTSKYLQMPQGKPNLNIFEIIKPELRPSISSGIHEALLMKKQVDKDVLKVKINGGSETIRILIKPIIKSKKDFTYNNTIIIFPEVSKKTRSRNQKGIGEERIKDLEQELHVNKESLRSLVEELETANEELRSSNEEYQSTNEELQSSNEELETSREELQSVNEELTTINNEYQKKIEILATINDDMQNLLSSTGIATIFLDTGLVLLRFTPAAVGIFNFRDPDIGRPLSDITHQIKSINLVEEAKKVLNSLVPFEKIIQTGDVKWYYLRIHPYRTAENAIAGVGITLVDVSEKEQVK